MMGAVIEWEKVLRRTGWVLLLLMMMVGRHGVSIVMMVKDDRLLRVWTVPHLSDTGRDLVRSSRMVLRRFLFLFGRFRLAAIPNVVAHQATQLGLIAPKAGMAENIQVPVDEFPDKAPSVQFSNKGRHVSNVKEFLHLPADKLAIVGDAKLGTAWHPAKDVLFGFIVEELHENLGEDWLSMRDHRESGRYSFLPISKNRCVDRGDSLSMMMFPSHGDETRSGLRGHSAIDFPLIVVPIGVHVVVEISIRRIL